MPPSSDASRRAAGASSSPSASSAAGLPKESISSLQQTPTRKKTLGVRRRMTLGDGSGKVISSQHTPEEATPPAVAKPPAKKNSSSSATRTATAAPGAAAPASGGHPASSSSSVHSHVGVYSSLVPALGSAESMLYHSMFMPPSSYLASMMPYSHAAHSGAMKAVTLPPSAPRVPVLPSAEEVAAAAASAEFDSHGLLAHAFDSSTTEATSMKRPRDASHLFAHDDERESDVKRPRGESSDDGGGNAIDSLAAVAAAASAFDAIAPLKLLSQPDGEYMCHVCSKTFTSKSSLSNHKLTHTDRYQCVLCGRRTASSAHLRTHMAMHAKQKADGKEPRAVNGEKRLDTGEIVRTKVRPKKQQKVSQEQAEASVEYETNIVVELLASQAAVKTESKEDMDVHMPNETPVKLAQTHAKTSAVAMAKQEEAQEKRPAKKAKTEEKSEKLTKAAVDAGKKKKKKKKKKKNAHDDADDDDEDMPPAVAEKKPTKKAKQADVKKGDANQKPASSSKSVSVPLASAKPSPSVPAAAKRAQRPSAYATYDEAESEEELESEEEESEAEFEEPKSKKRKNTSTSSATSRSKPATKSAPKKSASPAAASPPSRRSSLRTRNYYEGQYEDGGEEPQGQFAFVDPEWFVSEKSQPFRCEIDPLVPIVLDIHSHLLHTEVIGLLGGMWHEQTNVLQVVSAHPCRTLSTGNDHVNVELDPVSQIEVSEAIRALGQIPVGWYHSHPVFRNDPSVIDVQNQMSYQSLFRHSGHAHPAPSGVPTAPFIAAIVTPFGANDFRPLPSSIKWFSTISQREKVRQQRKIFGSKILEKAAEKDEAYEEEEGPTGGRKATKRKSAASKGDDKLEIPMELWTTIKTSLPPKTIDPSVPAAYVTPAVDTLHPLIDSLIAEYRTMFTRVNFLRSWEPDDEAAEQAERSTSESESDESSESDEEDGQPKKAKPVKPAKAPRQPFVPPSHYISSKLDQFLHSLSGHLLALQSTSKGATWSLASSTPRSTTTLARTFDKVTGRVQSPYYSALTPAHAKFVRKIMRVVEVWKSKDEAGESAGESEDEDDEEEEEEEKDSDVEEIKKTPASSQNKDSKKKPTAVADGSSKPKNNSSSLGGKDSLKKKPASKASSLPPSKLEELKQLELETMKNLQSSLKSKEQQQQQQHAASGHAKKFATPMDELLSDAAVIQELSTRTPMTHPPSLLPLVYPPFLPLPLFPSPSPTPALPLPLPVMAVAMKVDPSKSSKASSSSSHPSSRKSKGGLISPAQSTLTMQSIEAAAAAAANSNDMDFSPQF